MKINRLLKIIFILMNRNDITVKYLSEQFSVSKKTIYRDLETLILSGIPVSYGEDHKGIVSIMEGYSLKYAFLPDKDNKKKMFDINAFTNKSVDTSDEMIEVYAEAWQTFISQKTFHIKELKSEILQSWTRCQRANVPINYVSSDYIMNPKDADQYIIESLDVYKEESFKIFDSIVKNLAMDISICDQAGKLKYIFNYNKLVEGLYPNNGYILDASEYTIGTNSTGLAIAENKPVMVIGPEHYNQAFHRFSCCAAPIYKDNQLVGTVNASFMHTSLTNNTLNVVYSLARLYESLVINHMEEMPVGVVEIRQEEEIVGSLFDELIGESRQFEAVKQSAMSLAKTKIPILIAGEIGVGKSCLAKAIHYDSDRKDGPCIEFDCLSVPEDLLKISLFGYEGKDTSRRGVFEEAIGGSLILSNIHVLPGSLQNQISGFLISNKLKSGVSNKLISYDVRLIVCMTETSISHISEGLRKNIETVKISIPPLRDRPDDIKPLVSYYVKAMDKKLSLKPLDAASLVKQMIKEEWSGNIHELFNRLDKLAILETTDN